MINIIKRAAESKSSLEMIYLDSKENITQRRIKVLEVKGELFRAYCYTRKQQRIFRFNNVLSVGPIKRYYRGA